MLSFMGIGAQKCGTSWLYHTLARHPRIAFPGGKEVHYWDRQSGRSRAEYLQLFADPAQIHGDITPAYGILPMATIREIRTSFPELRLIYLLRNPIDRAWSSARMALRRAEMLHEEASDQWFIDHFNSLGSMARGDYESCIRRWRSEYSSEQLLVVRYENIQTDPVGIANQCLVHVGVDPIYTQAERPLLQEQVFQGDGVPLRPALHRALVGLYADRIASLSSYLGQNYSAWLQATKV